jgi:hypothetical protein
MSSQDPADRSCRDTELGTEPVLPSAMFLATVQDLLLDLRTRARRRRVWSGASIVKPSLTFGSEPGDPPVSALAGHAHRFGDVRDRHPGLDAFDEESTTVNGQTSITVTHEGLLVCEAANSTRPGGLHSCQQTRVTNLVAGYT